MPEVVVTRVDVLERVDDRGVDQLLDRGLELRESPAGDSRKDVRCETTSDDGARAGHVAGTFGQPPDSRQNGVPDRVRHAGVADDLAVRSRVLRKGSQQLLDMQGNAFRTLV